MAEIELDFEELKDVYVSLREFSECAVCLQPLRIDTVLCVNGHVICAVCKGGQDTCPTCRKEFSNVENPAYIRQVLGLLPITCKYEGCTEIVIKDDDHEEICSFRPTNCKVCEWKGPVQQLKEHCNEHYLLRFWTMRDDDFCIEKFHGPSFSLYNENTNVCVSIGEVDEGQLLWIESKYNADSGLTFSFEVILNGRFQFEALLVKVTFEDDIKQFSFGVKVRSYQSEKRDNKLNVPVNILEDFTSAGQLNYNIEILPIAYKVFGTKKRKL